MLKTKFKAICYDFFPLSAVLFCLGLMIFGVILSTVLGIVQGIIWGDASGAGWTLSFAVILSIPAFVVSLPWSQSLSMAGEAQLIVIGSLINGFIGLVFWRIYLAYKKR